VVLQSNVSRRSDTAPEIGPKEARAIIHAKTRLFGEGRFTKLYSIFFVALNQFNVWLRCRLPKQGLKPVQIREERLISKGSKRR
jgi:hypothetical protein